MPRHRQILWLSLSAAVLVSWTVSMAAARAPIGQDPQEQGAPGQDPFETAAQNGKVDPAKGSAGDADKPAEKAAESKAAKKAEPEFVQKSLREWQRTLPRAVFEVTRLKATEPPFSGRFATGHFNGTFICACCDAELFSSRTKFDSGTGWPSFWQPINRTAIGQAIDNSDAEVRMEVMCRRCGAHLGHVFEDGPPPTGLRYCINSLSLKLKAPERESGKSASTKAKAKSKAKATRTRSRKVRGTDEADDEAPAEAKAPAAGKTDESGQ
jgi:peptide-methionine (R)-S-oxide reductase